MSSALMESGMAASGEAVWKRGEDARPGDAVGAMDEAFDGEKATGSALVDRIVLPGDDVSEVALSLGLDA